MSRSWTEKPKDTKSVKRWMRWHKHNLDVAEPPIRNPDKYLHAAARKRKQKERYAEYLK